MRSTKALHTAWLLACLCIVVPASAGEKIIAISDSLAANADPQPVKVGNQWFGQITKYQIGEYAVVSSKRRSTEIKTKSNFFQTKFERHSRSKFSFVMHDAGTGSISVEAVRHAMDESTHEITARKSVRNSEMLQESDSCMATMRVGGDTTETWSLLKWSSTAPERRYEAYLSNGTRTVSLVPVRGASRADSTRKRSFFSRVAAGIMPPPLGYEFVENGRSIGALQTFGGLSRENRMLAWMDRRLDPQLRLVLAAAMTTVLQVESSSTGLEPPGEQEER